MHIGTHFAHLLDSGGMRRATLRGQPNLEKRYKIAAATYNLSQLLRHLCGIGTPKQAAARVMRALQTLLTALKMFSPVFRTSARLIHSFGRESHRYLSRHRRRSYPAEKGLFSTGC
jgi:hypothetical protein